MKNSLFMITVLLSMLSLAACDVNEGGPEELGENIEETADNLGNSIEDTCEEVKQGVQADNTDC